MSNIAGTSRLQTRFLRAFHHSPTGPTADLWPTPAILRRWLRKPNFRRALFSLIQALRFQADFNLAASAAVASQSLASPTEDSARQTARHAALLRLSHLHRFGQARVRRRADAELPDLEDPELPASSDRAFELAQQAIEFLAPADRLTDDEFHDLAVNHYHYTPNDDDDDDDN